MFNYLRKLICCFTRINITPNIEESMSYQKMEWDFWLDDITKYGIAGRNSPTDIWIMNDQKKSQTIYTKKIN